MEYEREGNGLGLGIQDSESEAEKFLIRELRLLVQCPRRNATGSGVRLGVACALRNWICVQVRLCFDYITTYLSGIFISS